jgi:hypothetical protein
MPDNLYFNTEQGVRCHKMENAEIVLMTNIEEEEACAADALQTS